MLDAGVDLRDGQIAAQPFEFLLAPSGATDVCEDRREGALASSL
jgi:hypothetical protein